MSLDIAAVQQALAADGLDGWLLYDFHGSNPIAAKLAGLLGKHTTRRWYYFIPVSGSPRKVVHAIEPFMLDALPGDKQAYAGREQLATGVEDLLRGATTLAMEYSPNGAIPVSLPRRRRHARVHPGARQAGRVFRQPRPAIRGGLGRGGDRDASHGLRKAVPHQGPDVRICGREALGRRRACTSLPFSSRWSRGSSKKGLVADAAPIVGAQENAGNPHYAPTRDVSRPIRPNELLLLDLWGKLETPGAVYADITWTGFAGDAPAEIARAFEVIVQGRDAAVAKVKSAVAAGQPLHGWEVDRATRDVIAAAGFGDRFIHRTGHSLGEEVHGNGVHMDDYETHDDRLLLPGTGFTIEPGIYTPTFGVRTEINMVVGREAAEVTGPLQKDLVRIATR